MAIDQDILVIGGGLAGITAAISAARSGARTRLLSHKQSTLRQASGLIDVLGYQPGAKTPLSDPFTGLDSLDSTHPYRLVGRDAIESGLELFDTVTDGHYCGDHTRLNSLVPTHGGRVKPTARYPRTVAGGLASARKDMLLVGFERLPTFDPVLSAHTLEAAGVPFSVRGARVEFPVEVSPDATVTRFAHLLDRGISSDGSGVNPTSLAACVRPHLGDERRVGFPALLGKNRNASIREQIAAELDVDVFEIPTGPPSLLGIRLEEILSAALEREGVLLETGNPVVGYSGESSVESVSVDRNGSPVPYTADEFILATGGLVGQGIDSDREAVREPIFDCHIPHPADRYDWFEREAFDDHAFARFGVQVNKALRPQSKTDEPEFPNLRAAGAVLGNYDYAAEKSASGVSLATGYRAGTLAGENV